DGIDKDECKDDSGLWETSTGAEFGKANLEKLKDYIAKTIDSHNEKPKEFIICAACVYQDGQSYANGPTNVETGFVIAGRRHNNCIATFAKMYGFPYSPIAKNIHNTEVQGFLTNTNRFVTRHEALMIATAANQLILGEGNQNLGLFSEDLY
ncbi:MAG: hypothetical protein IT245_07000, partial [Bacteroidia bacterium]|nr:hypothetical protein [Bacteroidia bacterium]